MITPLEVPKLTITMEDGQLLRWLKQEGERVVPDEPIYEIETDKVVVEVRAPAAGVLRRILVNEGPVAVGATIGYLGEAADIVPDPGARQASPPSPAFVAASPAGSAPRSEAPKEPGMQKATPAARRRARELGVDLSIIHGTGPEGRITQEDVERAASSGSS